MSGTVAALPSSAAAFDAIADVFDERYGAWLSVAAQRQAVRDALAKAFPARSRVLEVGGGTGEDAHWLARQGRHVVMTDASPRMVAVARRKLTGCPGAEALVASAEALHEALPSQAPFDGAFSNFAALNCVTDLEPVARGLAALLRPGAPLLLVLFGPVPPGEIVVQLARRDPAGAFRRLRRGPVTARLGSRHFTIRYHRPVEVADAFGPWFRLVRRLGIGIFVPPSAAEPWISGHPSLLRTLERLDRIASRPLALLGDHVLFWLERREQPAHST